MPLSDRQRAAKRVAYDPGSMLEGCGWRVDECGYLVLVDALGMDVYHTFRQRRDAAVLLVAWVFGWQIERMARAGRSARY